VKKVLSITKLFVIFISLTYSSLNFAQIQNEAWVLPSFNQSHNKNYDSSIDNGEHWWKFDAQANEGITVALTANLNAGHVYVYLYDINGTNLGLEGPISDGQTQFFSEQIAATGTYYLKVWSNVPATGNYDLAVYSAWHNAGITDQNRGFHYSFDTAYYLTNGTKTLSHMPSGDDLDDYYRFTANAGSTITASLTGQFNTGSVYLFLHDVNGTSLGVVGIISNGQTKILSEANLAAGVYYLRVQSNSAVGSYTLSITGVNADADNDSDGLTNAAEYYHRLNPNIADSDGDGSNDFVELGTGNKPNAAISFLDNQVSKSEPTATLVPYKNKVFNSEFKSANGEHWWKFDAQANEGITVALTANLNAGHVYVYLYDINGTNLGLEGPISDGQTQFFSEQIAATGTYYLKVWSNVPATGNYDLAVYSAWHNAGITDQNRGFHYSFDTAYYLTNGTKTLSHMPSGDDLDDYYRFTANAGSTITASLTGQFNTGSVYLFLHDVNGTSLGVVGIISNGQTKILSEANLAAGDYYLRVQSNSAVGNYILSASFNGTSTQTSTSLDNTDLSRLASLIADPLDVSTGAHVLSRNVMHTQGALSLDMALNYNSLNPVDGNMGFGWQHGFDMKLVVQADLSIRVYWPSGRITNYNSPSAAGLYQTVDGDAKDRLTKLSTSFKLIDRNQITYTFNSTGALTQKTTKTGLSTNFSYTSGKLTQVTEPLSGRHIDFTYNAAGRVASASAVDAGTVSFTYDPTTGDLITITDALNQSEQFTYNAEHRVLTGKDALNVVYFSNIYDAQGRVVQQEDARTGNLAGVINYVSNADGTTANVYSNRTGGIKTYVHDSQYRLTSVTDELGHTEKYSYDALGNQISVTDALGRTEYSYYDLNSNLIQVVDAKGQGTYFEYDTSNNLIKITNAKGQSNQFTYVNNRLTKITDEAGQYSQTEYAISGLVTATIKPSGAKTNFTIISGQTQSITDATGHVVTIIYDGAGRLKSMEDADNHKTQYEYDLNGQLTKVIDPLLNYVAYTYDAKGKRLTARNARGYITKYAYDDNDKLISETDALDGITRYTYDGEDRVKTIINALNHTVATFTYDFKGQVVTVKDALNRETNFSYDAVGNKTSETNVLNDVVSYQYDALNQMIKQVDALNQMQLLAYDELGNLITQTDANLQQTHYAYDALNRHKETLDAANGTVKQNYNIDGLRTALIDPNNQTLQFDYDVEGRLLKTTTMDGNFWQASYNAQGQISQTTNGRGDVSQYAYDAASQISLITEDFTNISYEYDENGNRIKVVDTSLSAPPIPGRTWLYTYDALDRLSSHTDHNGNVIEYKYDAIGQLTKLIYPDARQVNYTYDKVGQLTQVVDWVNRQTKYEYDVLGRVSKAVHSNGLYTQYTYDEVGQLKKQETKNIISASLINYDFSYNQLGLMTGETGFDSQRYQDAGMAAQMGYISDNRLSELLSVGMNSYDADGNMNYGWVNGENRDLNYDTRNMLTSIHNVGSAVNDFYYDYNPDNQRISKSENQLHTSFIVNPAATLEQVLMETDENNVTQSWYVYGLGLIGRQDSAGNYQTYHYDYRGSTVALSNNSGLLTDRYYYAPFGELVKHEGVIEQPFAYNGRDGVMTDASGLYYMRARYYNPELKRFINRDVLLGNAVLSSSLNRYGYVQGNPAMLVDPKGNYPLAVVGAAVGGVFSAGVYGATVYFDDSKDFNWYEFGGAVAGGAVGGAVATITGPAVLMGAISGFSGSVIDKLISVGLNDDPEAVLSLGDGGDILFNTALGGGLGKLTSLAKISKNNALPSKIDKTSINNTANKILRNLKVKLDGKKFKRKFPGLEGKLKFISNRLTRYDLLNSNLNIRLLKMQIKYIAPGAILNGLSGHLTNTVKSTYGLK